MATRKSNPDDAPVNFDDLLASEVPATDAEIAVEQGTINGIPVGEPELVVEGSVNGIHVGAGEIIVENSTFGVAPHSDVPDFRDMTPGQRKIAEMKAKLRQAQDAARKADRAAAVEEDDGLTDEEREEIKLIEDELAKVNNSTMVSAPVQYDNSQKGGTGQKILFHVVLDGFTAFGNVWLRGQEIEVEVGTEAYKRTLDENGKSWIDLRNDLAGQYARWSGRQYIADGPFIPRRNENFDDEVARADVRRGRTVPVLVGL